MRAGAQHLDRRTIDIKDVKAAEKLRRVGPWDDLQLPLYTVGVDDLPGL